MDIGEDQPAEGHNRYIVCRQGDERRRNDEVQEQETGPNGFGMPLICDHRAPPRLGSDLVLIETIQPQFSTDQWDLVLSDGTVVPLLDEAQADPFAEMETS